MQELKLLLYRSALATPRKHRIKIDDIGRHRKIAQDLQAIAFDNLHAPGGIRKLWVTPRAFDGIYEHRGDDRVAFDQRHGEAGSREQQGVLPEAGRRIYERRFLNTLEACGAHEKLAVELAVEQAPLHIVETRAQAHAITLENEPIRIAPQLESNPLQFIDTARVHASFPRVFLMPVEPALTQSNTPETRWKHCSTKN